MPSKGELVQLRIERDAVEVGSIYKGRIERVLPGMDSCFVDIGLDRNTFMHVSDFIRLRKRPNRRMRRRSGAARGGQAQPRVHAAHHGCGPRGRGDRQVIALPRQQGCSRGLPVSPSQATTSCCYPWAPTMWGSRGRSSDSVRGRLKKSGPGTARGLRHDRPHRAGAPRKTSKRTWSSCKTWRRIKAYRRRRPPPCSTRICPSFGGWSGHMPAGQEIIIDRIGV